MMQASTGLGQELVQVGEAVELGVFHDLQLGAEQLAEVVVGQGVVD
jgi:hypothetical protein